MNIRLLTAEKPTRTDLLFLLVFEGEVPLAPEAMAAAVRNARATGDVNADFRAVSVFHVQGRGPRRLAFVGMGKKKDLSAERLRRAAALMQQKAEELKVAAFQLRISAQDLGEVDARLAGVAIAEGLLLGAYRYAPPSKSKPKARHAQQADVLHAGLEHSELAAGFELGRQGGEATTWARDMENMAPNIVTPAWLAKAARQLAGPGVKVRVLEQAEMRRLKMGALLGVAKGSVEPPKLIVLEHAPAGAKRTVCVVGKGLTFDSGGISIKPAAKMDEMRYDMCGGGAVLGLFHAIRHGALKGSRGKTRIIGLVGATENMPDGRAQKPGDVVTACDGTTIEVLNTDAEGRLVLADVLAYAIKSFAPAQIVDLATLTGAVVVALGHEIAGIMGTDPKLISALQEAGKTADEPLWQLPLLDEHREQTKSKFADLANINGPQHGAGTIAGAAFLSHFVEGTPWAHLDIAGTAWGGRAKDYYRSGAAGTAVRTLIHWVRALG